MRGARLGLALVLLGPSHALAARGGPDAFGYVYVDSDEPDGPTHSWLDAPRPVDVPTAGMREIALPFAFPFYGETFTRVFVGDDGILVFDGEYPGGLHRCLPTLDGPAVLPLWDLLDSAAGTVSSGNHGNNDARVFVVEYSDVPQSTTEQPVSFQVHLHEDGAIEYHYSAVEAAGGGGTATVGLDDGDGTAIQYGCDEANLAAGLSIRFTPDGVGGDDDDVVGNDDDSAEDDTDVPPDPLSDEGCQSECRGAGVRFGAWPALLLPVALRRRRE